MAGLEDSQAITLRLPKDLHAQVKFLAQLQDRSVVGVVEEALRAHMAGRGIERWMAEYERIRAGAAG